MAEKLDPKQVVTFEELLTAMMFETVPVGSENNLVGARRMK